MSVKPFFDTNVLLYTLQAEDKRSEAARRLLADGGVISVQSLNEFVSVARRKLGMRWAEIHEAITAFESLCPSPHAITMKVHTKALQIAERYGYRIFDSLILATALEAACSTLYSEDLQDGQVIEGLTIRNPFAIAS